MILIVLLSLFKWLGVFSASWLALYFLHPRLSNGLKVSLSLYFSSVAVGWMIIVVADIFWPLPPTISLRAILFRGILSGGQVVFLAYLVAQRWRR